jgi:toxin ParE1/3/4
LTAFRIRTSAAAKADVREALQYSAFRFGSAAMSRYADLIAQTLDDVRAELLGTGSRERADLGNGIRTRHLKASAKGTEVHDPRHIVFYQVNGAHILVLRILHEARDLPSHLPS